MIAKAVNRHKTERTFAILVKSKCAQKQNTSKRKKKKDNTNELQKKCKEQQKQQGKNTAKHSWKSHSNNKSLQVNEAEFDWLNYAHRDRNVNTCSVFFFQLHFISFDNFFSLFFSSSSSFSVLCAMNVVLILVTATATIITELKTISQMQNDKKSTETEREHGAILKRVRLWYAWCGQVGFLSVANCSYGLLFSTHFKCGHRSHFFTVFISFYTFVRQWIPIAALNH